jgi:CheY-like chemotaxis protein
MTRILIVDDDPSARGAMRAHLNREGYEVEVAADGQIGLVIARSIVFDLLIVDIFMPGMDGLETIKALRDCVPDVPIIAISGFVFRQARRSAPDFLSMATKLGATMSLRKPIRPRDLLSAVEACIGRSVTACRG